MEQALTHTPHYTTHSVSLIIPVFNEALVIPELINQIKKLTVVISDLKEVLFIDDGSTDETIKILIEHCRSLPYIQIIALTRNFGHQHAVTAGLELATGDIVAVIDADLQDPPELLPLMMDRLKNGYDVVYAVRSSRKEFFPKRFVYKSFYRLLSWLAEWDIPLDAGDFCVMTRRVVDEMNKLPEKNRFLRGIRSWVGYRQTGFPYDRPARYADVSKYTLPKLIHLGLDGLFAFSLRPLRIVVCSGALFACLSFLLATVYIYRRLFLGLNPPGFATLAVITLFMGGIQLISLGLLGEYIGRIYQEVKQRPLYLIKQLIRPHDLND